MRQRFGYEEAEGEARGVKVEGADAGEEEEREPKIRGGGADSQLRAEARLMVGLLERSASELLCRA